MLDATDIELDATDIELDDPDIESVSICQSPLEVLSEQDFRQSVTCSNVFLKFNQKTVTIGFATPNSLLCVSVSNLLFSAEDMTRLLRRLYPSA